MSIDKIGSSEIRTDTITEKAAVSESAEIEFKELLESSISSGPTDLDDIFRRAAERFGVSENLLKAVAKAESGFNPSAVSRSGAQGIMQLMPATARSFGVTDAFDPEQNIMAGAELLSGLLAKYDGDVSLALAGYNAGSGAVDRYGGIPPYTETRNYVARVMEYLGQDISAGYVTVLSRGSKAGYTLSAEEDSDLMATLKENMILQLIMNQPKGLGSEDEDEKKIF